jgi:hypothetical protein
MSIHLAIGGRFGQIRIGFFHGVHGETYIFSR